MIVDHINHDTLDNRQTNLRVCEHYENMRNRKLQKNNTTGATGIKFMSGKWYAFISNGDGTRSTIGHFDKKHDAIVARKQAEMEYYGEFAPKK